MTGRFRGVEDCLVLHVYSKRIPKQINEDKSMRHPVMVFIHGGGFMSGDCSTEFYGPEYLLDGDVVGASSENTAYHIITFF